MSKKYNFICKPVTDNLWKDFEQLFGKNGAYWGCWCMYWRCTNKDFEKMKGNERKEVIHKCIIKEQHAPGILAFLDNNPVGWLAMSPREEFKRIVNSRVIKPPDNKSVWSIVCFFIHADFRGLGVSKALLSGAEEYAKSQGAVILESYPVDTVEKIEQTSAYVGTKKMFEEAGFMKIIDTNAKSGGKKRILMRKEI